MLLGIYGAGGLGREVLELAVQINKTDQRWDDYFVIDDVISADGGSAKSVNGVQVYPYQYAVEKFSGKLEIAVGIGEPVVREKFFAKLREDGIPSPTLIHPEVYIPKTTVVGKGTTIQYGCFVSCNVVIEDHVFVQPQVNVGHDDHLKTGCILSGMANLGGKVTVGKYSYVGLSAAIKQGVSIGDYSVVGMYSAVYKDIPDRMIAMGNPARPMKRNEEYNVFH